MPPPVARLLYITPSYWEWAITPWQDAAPPGEKLRDLRIVVAALSKRKTRQPRLHALMEITVGARRPRMTGPPFGRT